MLYGVLATFNQGYSLISNHPSNSLAGIRIIIIYIQISLKPFPFFSKKGPPYDILNFANGWFNVLEKLYPLPHYNITYDN